MSLLWNNFTPVETQESHHHWSEPRERGLFQEPDGCSETPTGALVSAKQTGRLTRLAQLGSAGCGQGPFVSRRSWVQPPHRTPPSCPPAALGSSVSPLPGDSTGPPWVAVKSLRLPLPSPQVPRGMCPATGTVHSERPRPRLPPGVCRSPWAPAACQQPCAPLRARTHPDQCPGQ